MSLFGRKRVYLDYASAVPVRKEAKNAFNKSVELFGNPSSIHEEGRNAKESLEDARTRIARILGVKAETLIFTANGTEANALAIRGTVNHYLKSRSPEDIHILYLPTAHSSVFNAIQALKEEGIQVEPLKLSEGAIDLEVLKTQLKKETVLVSVDRVCGETGTLFDTRSIRRILDEQTVSTDRVRLHVDACQAAGIENIEHSRLGADYLSLDAQKIGGVRGIGALVIPVLAPMSPLMEGGGQERGFRSGTEANALASSFASAFMLAVVEREEFEAQSKRYRTYILEALQKEFPDVIENVGKEYMPHILNISLKGRDTEYLTVLLDEAGYSVSTKSACSMDEPVSRPVFELTGDNKRASSTLRISFGMQTTGKEIQLFVKQFAKSVRFIDTPLK